MINNLEIHKATGEKNNSFVGIKVVDNQIKFFYPEAYELSSGDDLRKDIFNILRTIRLTKSSKESSSFNEKFIKDDGYPLISYLWILNDYLENKKYLNKEKQFKLGQQGKIHWRKTLNQIPFFSGSNVVFRNFVSEVKQQQDNILTEIYAYCVNKSVKELGWYYNINKVFDDLGRYVFNKTRYLCVLKEEINKTFDDKKRQRLIHMKNIITGLDVKNIKSRDIIRGVDSYEHVFESMVDIMFGNVEYKSHFFPNANWNLLVNGNVESPKLRPDSIILKDRKAYIIDSKFYRYGTTFDSDDLPATSSIEKQITYGDYAKKIGKDYDDVFNAFVLPYSKNLNIHKDDFNFNQDMVFVGSTTAKWPQDNTITHTRIAVILIDLRFLIENYLRTNDTIVQDLIDKIENNVKDTSNE